MSIEGSQQKSIDKMLVFIKIDVFFIYIYIIRSSVTPDDTSVQRERTAIRYSKVHMDNMCNM